MIEFELIRSRRKTVSLEVKKDLSVVVRAPSKMSRAQIDAFVAKHERWLAGALARQRAAAENRVEHTPEELAAMKSKAKELLLPRVEYYSKLMGIEPAGVTITAAKTRFGSCSPKNRLSFSCLLVDYPAEARDYVVVHELAHIRQHNHSCEFYALIEKYMPDYRERIRLLKR